MQDVVDRIKKICPSDTILVGIGANTLSNNPGTNFLVELMDIFKEKTGLEFVKTTGGHYYKEIKKSIKGHHIMNVQLRDVDLEHGPSGSDDHPRKRQRVDTDSVEEDDEYEREMAGAI